MHILRDRTLSQNCHILPLANAFVVLVFIVKWLEHLVCLVMAIFCYGPLKALLGSFEKELERVKEVLAEIVYKFVLHLRLQLLEELFAL